MKTQDLNRIALPVNQSENLIQALNELLANYSIFYMNVRGFHWNIKGRDFFELHLKFEELYTALQLKIDELAERILTLGGQPLHSYSAYLKLSSIAERTQVSEGAKALSLILDDFKTLLLKQRSLLALAQEAQDEGSAALMSDYLREQEKLVWMYAAFLG